MGRIVTGEFEAEKLSEAFPDLVATVLEGGREVESRIGRTKEVVNLNLRLWHPDYCVVGRENLSKEFMEAEVMLILAGVFDEEMIRAAVPRAAELIATATAYGPRTYQQVREVVKELKEHPDSRRAVVYVGREDDLEGVRGENKGAFKAEMPCTMTWQFLMRDDLLHMVVNMRSWDLVWGLCYDVPSFVAIQMAVAHCVGVPIGAYLHNSGSAHIYEKHWDVKCWVNAQDPAIRLDWMQGTESINEIQEEAHVWCRNKRRDLGLVKR